MGNRKNNHRFIVSLILLMMVFVMTVPHTAYAKKAEKTAISNKKLQMAVSDKTKIVLNNPIEKVKWTVSNKKIATIKASGKWKNTCSIEAKQSGTVTIKAKCGKKTYKCKVTVKEVEISSKSLEMKDNQVQSVTLSNVTGEVKWSSSNDNVAFVTDKGNHHASCDVTAVNGGKTVIKAEYNGRTYYCLVNVKKTKTDSVDINDPEPVDPTPVVPKPNDPTVVKEYVKEIIYIPVDDGNKEEADENGNKKVEVEIPSEETVKEKLKGKESFECEPNPSLSYETKDNGKTLTNDVTFEFKKSSKDDTHIHTYQVTRTYDKSVPVCEREVVVKKECLEDNCDNPVITETQKAKGHTYLTDVITADELDTHVNDMKEKLIGKGMDEKNAETVATHYYKKLKGKVPNTDKEYYVLNVEETYRQMKEKPTCEKGATVYYYITCTECGASKKVAKPCSLSAMGHDYGCLDEWLNDFNNLGNIMSVCGAEDNFSEKSIRYIRNAFDMPNLLTDDDDIDSDDMDSEEIRDIEESVSGNNTCELLERFEQFKEDEIENYPTYVKDKTVWKKYVEYIRDEEFTWEDFLNEVASSVYSEENYVNGLFDKFNETGKWGKLETPTCSSDGKFTFTCPHCHDRIEIPLHKLGHLYNTKDEKYECQIEGVSVDATCTSNGIGVYQCVRAHGSHEGQVIKCDLDMEELEETIKKSKDVLALDSNGLKVVIKKAKGHDYSSEPFETVGDGTAVFENGNRVLNVNWKFDKEPTCTEKGKLYQVCGRENCKHRREQGEWTVSGNGVDGYANFIHNTVSNQTNSEAITFSYNPSSAVDDAHKTETASIRYDSFDKVNEDGTRTPDDDYRDIEVEALKHDVYKDDEIAYFTFAEPTCDDTKDIIYFTDKTIASNQATEMNKKLAESGVRFDNTSNYGTFLDIKEYMSFNNRNFETKISDDTVRQNILETLASLYAGRSGQSELAKYCMALHDNPSNLCPECFERPSSTESDRKGTVVKLINNIEYTLTYDDAMEVYRELWKAFAKYNGDSAICIFGGYGAEIMCCSRENKVLNTSVKVEETNLKESDLKTVRTVLHDIPNDKICHSYYVMRIDEEADSVDKAITYDYNFYAQKNVIKDESDNPINAIFKVQNNSSTNHLSNYILNDDKVRSIAKKLENKIFEQEGKEEIAKKIRKVIKYKFDSCTEKVKTETDKNGNTIDYNTEYTLVCDKCGYAHTIKKIYDGIRHKHNWDFTEPFDANNPEMLRKVEAYLYGVTYQNGTQFNWKNQSIDWSSVSNNSVSGNALIFNYDIYCGKEKIGFEKEHTDTYHLVSLTADSDGVDEKDNAIIYWDEDEKTYVIDKENFETAYFTVNENDSEKKYNADKGKSIGPDCKHTAWLHLNCTQKNEAQITCHDDNHTISVQVALTGDKKLVIVGTEYYGTMVTGPCGHHYEDTGCRPKCIFCGAIHNHCKTWGEDSLNYEKGKDYCIVCQAKYYYTKDNLLREDRLKHENMVSGNTIPPTCNTDEYQVKQCMDCGRVLVEKKEYSSLGHDLVLAYDEPLERNCVLGNLMHYKCSRCDYEQDKRSGNRGHKWKTIKSATCYQTGVKRCNNCEEEEVINKTPHKYLPNHLCENYGKCHCGETGVYDSSTNEKAFNTVDDYIRFLADRVKSNLYSLSDSGFEDRNKRNEVKKKTQEKGYYIVVNEYYADTFDIKKLGEIKWEAHNYTPDKNVEKAIHQTKKDSTNYYIGYWGMLVKPSSTLYTGKVIRQLEENDWMCFIVVKHNTEYDLPEDTSKIKRMEDLIGIGENKNKMLRYVYPNVTEIHYVNN